MYQIYKHIRQQLVRIPPFNLRPGGKHTAAYTGKSVADKADNRLKTPSAHTNLPIDVIILKNLTCQSPRELSG